MTLLAARAGAGYQILDNLALQVKVEHYRVGEGEANSRTLVGGGVAVSFKQHKIDYQRPRLSKPGPFA